MLPEPFVSYAQNGEDVVLARALCPDDQPGFWIDVGAADPVVDSVTAAFAQRGWTGINVEPSVPAYERLRAQRPHDVNLNCAAGARGGFAKLYPGPEGNLALSTLVSSIAERHYEQLDEAPSPDEVEVRTLAEIVEQHAPPVVDFLKVDVEGYESEVLAGADWTTFRPRVVVVEATEPNTKQLTHDAWELLLVQHGYVFTLFDGLNRFYVSDEARALAAELSIPANVLDDFVTNEWDEREQDTAREFALAEAYARQLEGEADRLAKVARMATDRATYADEVITGLEDDLAVVQMRAARALDRAAAAERSISAIEATKTFRVTRRARNAYSIFRRLSGQGS